MQDEAALTVLVPLSGDLLVDGHRGSAGDLALVRGPEPYVVSDPTATPPTIEIGPGQRCTIDRLLDLLVVGVVRRWLNAPGRAAPVTGLASADPVVAGALKLLHAEPATDWTVAALARRLHVSRFTLAARFRAGVGEPPMSHLARWCMTLAAGQLLDPGPTIAAIARDVGHDNAFAFGTAFKRQVGLSPSGYRRQLRDGHGN